MVDSINARSEGFDAHVAWCRHRGNFRKENEDTVLVQDLHAGPPGALADTGSVRLSSRAPGLLALVCDGVGGGAAGEVASALAARTFGDRLAAAVAAHETMQASDGDRGTWMTEAVTEAHTRLLDEARRERQYEGMGTTLTAAWLVGDALICAQVGDSRLYRFRRGVLTQVSRDQSFVGRLRQQGELTEHQARRHAMRNLVDQVVGGESGEIRPEVSVHKTAPGDTWLLCSDGLNDALTDRVIERELVRGIRRPVQDGAVELLELVLNTSGRDNVSIVLLRIGCERIPATRACLTRLSHAFRSWRSDPDRGRAPEPGAEPEARASGPDQSVG